MLVVDALWSPGRGLLLWGVDSERPVKSGSQALRSARTHPFAADTEALAEVHRGTPTAVALLLPSLRSAPLDPPELVRVAPRPAPQRSPALLPWRVPALAVHPSQLTDQSPLVRYGASFTYLRAVVAFAEDLVDRGRVLPSLQFEAGFPVARWRPVVTGPDAVRMHALVAAMPPVARAEIAGTLEDGAGEPELLLGDALAVLADRMVRERVTASGLRGGLPARRGRAPRVRPAAEAWVSALTAADGRIGANKPVNKTNLKTLTQSPNK